MLTNSAQHRTFTISDNRLLPPVVITLLLMLAVGSAATGFAQDDGPSRDLGTTAYEGADSVQQATPLPPVPPHVVFPNSGYSTGGVSLRNRGAGGISISGVIPPVKAAFIYWAVITPGAPPPPVSSILIEREFPAPETALLVLAGIPVGAGPPPCWPGAVITCLQPRFR